MLLVRREDIGSQPTSHDPGLLKNVMLGPGAVPGLLQFSRITFSEGATASEHVHEDACEVFLCLRGSVVFSMDGEHVVLNDGDCLAVSPGERHAVVETLEETELVYFMVMA